MVKFEESTDLRIPNCLLNHDSALGLCIPEDFTSMSVHLDVCNSEKLVSTCKSIKVRIFQSILGREVRLEIPQIQGFSIVQIL